MKYPCRVAYIVAAKSAKIQKIIHTQNIQEAYNTFSSPRISCESSDARNVKSESR